MWPLRAPVLGPDSLVCFTGCLPLSADLRQTSHSICLPQSLISTGDSGMLSTSRACSEDETSQHLKTIMTQLMHRERWAAVYGRDGDSGDDDQDNLFLKLHRSFHAHAFFSHFLTSICPQTHTLT